MGYVGEELVDLAPPLERAVRRVGERGAKKVGEKLRADVRRFSPVAQESPEARASFESRTAWLAARRRRPGTLKDSWVQQPTEELAGTRGLRFRVVVESFDPVAPHVEWNTRPHIIRAKALSVPTRSGMSFPAQVQHPGTQGVHMMSRAMLQAAGTWERTVRGVWDEEVREVWAA
jgi:hypothetical protein